MLVAGVWDLPKDVMAPYPQIRLILITVPRPILWVLE